MLIKDIINASSNSINALLNNMSMSPKIFRFTRGEPNILLNIKGTNLLAHEPPYIHAGAPQRPASSIVLYYKQFYIL